MKKACEHCGQVNEGRPPNCNICGKFCRHVCDRQHQWQCPDVGWDDYAGGWEHA